MISIINENIDCKSDKTVILLDKKYIFSDLYFLNINNNYL